MRDMATRAVPGAIPSSSTVATSERVGSSGGDTPRRVEAMAERAVSRLVGGFVGGRWPAIEVLRMDAI